MLKSEKQEVNEIRRQGSPFNGKRFIGNNSSKEVHDLDNEQTEDGQCQIDEIKTDHIVTFDPDELWKAKQQGYDPCDKCLPGSQH